MRVFICLILSFLFISAAVAEPIVTESTSNSNVTTNGTNDTTVKSPPPSAISPSINGNNADLCTIGVRGAVQTQIVGISAGKTVRDMNCERLKLSKTMYDMGMKVAAVSIMCQDQRVFDAMEMAGTPCPFLGKIGAEAQKEWGSPRPVARPRNIEEDQKNEAVVKDNIVKTVGGVLLLILLL